MDIVSSDTLQEKNEHNTEKVPEHIQPEGSTADGRKQPTAFVGDVLGVNKTDAKSKEFFLQDVAPAPKVTSGELDMEASITSDDVMRAGGLGATDDINCFLPGAIDFTDFEASLRDAREYEDPQEQVLRPGIGCSEAMK